MRISQLRIDALRRGAGGQIYHHGRQQVGRWIIVNGDEREENGILAYHGLRREAEQLEIAAGHHGLVAGLDRANRQGREA